MEDFMKERPILFSGPMVQAILDGQKTQTRRVVNEKWLPIIEECLRVNGKWAWSTIDHDLTTPYGQVGDRLWVRETFSELHEGVAYRATAPNACLKNTKWKPSIFMPRWASRITLEITDVRVERLKDITEDGAVSEGVKYYIASGAKQAPEMSMVAQFSELWNSINEKRGYGWDTNPFVWVIEFKKL
jgi:hypothetical protein